MGCGAPVDSVADERRTVTVLFADLSGFTAMSERMDHEQVKSIVDHFLGRLSDEVRAVGGRVERLIGDNVMAVFGAPAAHEDDPARAVHAGLAMQAVMPSLSAETGTTFTLRVGINTGEVTAGTMGGEYTVMGDAVNVAARLQTAARPGAVLVGEQTYRATCDAFSFAPVVWLDLKGKSQPVPAWEAHGPLGRRSDGRPVGGGFPLLGRDDELRRLREQLEQTVAGASPRLVTVLGEPGVGKSRLTEELMAGAARRAAVRRGRTPAFGPGAAFWPLAEIVRAECEITEADDATTAFSKLRRRAGEADGDDPAAQARSRRRAALIAHLIGIDTDEQLAGDDSDPLEVRRAAFAAVTAFLETLARQRPLLLVVEDIHWAGPEMLELLEVVATSAQGPMLIVCIARDELLEQRPDWGSGVPGSIQIKLEPLGEADTRALLRARMQTLDAPLIDLLARRSGGNPFFAEELVHRASEQGRAAAEDLPTNVQAVLTARLDSLPPAERQVVQFAAVLDPSLSPDLLRELVPSPDDLDRAIAELLRREVLVTGGPDRLAFRHALIRDVAYATLAKTHRAGLHTRVARLLARRAGDRREEVVALLAEHHDRAARLAAEAGLPADDVAPLRRDAAEALEAAGDVAAARYSNLEALAHYAKARGWFEPQEPRPAARTATKEGQVALRLGRPQAAVALWRSAFDRREADGDHLAMADLHRRIGGALRRLDRSDEAVAHFQAGIALIRDMEASRELAALYEDAAELYADTGQDLLAVYAAEKAVRTAEHLGENGAAGHAHGVFGRIMARSGDGDRAREHLRRSVELARASGPFDHLRALLALGRHLDDDGDDRGARQAFGEGLEIARRVGDTSAEADLEELLARLGAGGAARTPSA